MRTLASQSAGSRQVYVEALADALVRRRQLPENEHRSFEGHPDRRRRMPNEVAFDDENPFERFASEDSHDVKNERRLHVEVPDR